MTIFGMDLGPHWFAIMASYGLALVVIAGLSAWVMIDRVRLERTIAALEATGIRRRSASPAGQGSESR